MNNDNILSELPVVDLETLNPYEEVNEEAALKKVELCLALSFKAASDAIMFLSVNKEKITGKRFNTMNDFLSDYLQKASKANSVFRNIKLTNF